MTATPAPVVMWLGTTANVQVLTLSSDAPIHRRAATTQLPSNRMVRVCIQAIPATTDSAIPLTMCTKVTARAAAPWFQPVQPGSRWRNMPRLNTEQRTACTRRSTRLPMNSLLFMEP